MFKNRMFLAIASGHFAVDVLNSTGAVLLAVLKEPLGLSYAQIGTAITAYLLLGSLSQPLFGWISDRFPGRSMLLAALGVAWMAFFFTLVALAPTWTLLFPVFMLASLGSGLFHPVGTAAAAAAMPERAASATSVFFFAGQVGLASGPFLAGALAGLFGAPGLLPLVAMAIVPTIMLLVAARHERSREVRPRKTVPARSAPNWSLIGASIIVAFIVLVALRSSVQAVYQAYLPQLFQGRGWDPALFGLLAGIFMAAGAVGQMINGAMADRYGMRVAVVWPLLLSIPAGLLCLLTPSVGIAFIACALAGLLVGGQHSVLVVHAQRLLPVKQGFAAGLILGFTFASGAIGTWLAGQMADNVGMQSVMVWATLLSLPAALLALSLPGRKRPTPAPAVAPAPVGD
ncbi:MFS transporter [Candidatus Viridilinea mediisalina]|uniref:MFS transporter n=1 Tax=Candidatus Viridilinea mediisalina TaxID=2024553 RepID=A0A2A6RDW4_9CHLR|nr:MFS transporter [Candidatus Viridilinea mediisalina]PDW00988.1 MFS transporter [Candidatus Viridilinea mediisalina]